jgi:hypothetical protein
VPHPLRPGALVYAVSFEGPTHLVEKQGVMETSSNPDPHKAILLNRRYALNTKIYEIAFILMIIDTCLVFNSNLNSLVVLCYISPT